MWRRLAKKWGQGSDDGACVSYLGGRRAKYCDSLAGLEKEMWTKLDFLSKFMNSWILEWKRMLWFIIVSTINSFQTF